jgi:hypothetical protein
MNGWTDVQLQLFQQAYMDEMDDSRLAHKVIPEYPLASSARSVSVDTFDYTPPGSVDDITQVSLEECQESFSLTRAQSEDEDLSSAQVIVRRAAQRLARGDDIRVFKTAIRDPISNAAPKSVNFQDVVDVDPTPDPNSNTPTGDGLIAAVAAAIAKLDGDGYRSGYVMVAGPLLYRLLYTRAFGAADLPVVAVRGLLNQGPVHRCTVLPEDEALVLSVGAGRIDRAVAISPVAEFLRVEQTQVVAPAVPEQVRLWRLYERFISRFKETRSVVLLRLQAPATAPALAPAPAPAPSTRSGTRTRSGTSARSGTPAPGPAPV